jgi:hypothetical protein
MSNKQNGYLMIADITGYTAYLHASELEHAEEVLRSLIDLLIEHTQLPLVISRLEGDAVISFADERSILQGQTLVEMMESTYVAFKRALELMKHNTTCTCNACRNIPNLDLKFFIHFGTYLLQKLPTYTELIGTDVNLVHRLTKNSIKEKTGCQAYVAYSQAAVEALGIQELAQTMTTHSEEYDHIGTVQMFVQDMVQVWERDKDRTRMVVAPEDAFVSFEYEFDLAPMLMWEFVTKPEYKAILASSDSAQVDAKVDGRIGLGSAYLCAHGENVLPQTIIDWQPFEQYTIRAAPVMGVHTLWTTQLYPTETGTKVIVRCGEVFGGNPFARWFTRTILPKAAMKNTQAGFEALQAQISKEIETGAIFQPEAIEFSPDSIRASIAEKLTA